MRQRFSWRSGWRHVVMALTLVLFVHQVVMVTPLRTTMPIMAVTNQPSNFSMPCDSVCPSGIISLCIPGRICAGAEATLTRLPITPLLLLALLIAMLMAIRTPILAFRREHWLWPPDRRRALLQVFLI